MSRYRPNTQMVFTLVRSLLLSRIWDSASRNHPENPDVPVEQELNLGFRASARRMLCAYVSWCTCWHLNCLTYHVQTRSICTRQLLRSVRCMTCTLCGFSIPDRALRAHQIRELRMRATSSMSLRSLNDTSTWSQ